MEILLKRPLVLFLALTAIQQTLTVASDAAEKNGRFPALCTHASRCR